MHIIFLLSLIQIEQDMGEIFSTENIRTEFETNWEQYVIGVLTYSETNTKLKSPTELDPSSM